MDRAGYGNDFLIRNKERIQMKSQEIFKRTKVASLVQREKLVEIIFLRTPTAWAR